MAKIPNPRDIILAPVVSEKSYGLMEENTYVFFVAKTANKTENQDCHRADLRRAGCFREYREP